MDKEVKIYFETERCKQLINSELDKFFTKFKNSTITTNNKNFLLKETIKKAKIKAFETINSMIKPHIVYKVNKHFYDLEN